MAIATQVDLLAERVAEEFNAVREEMSDAVVMILEEGDTVPPGSPPAFVVRLSA